MTKTKSHQIVAWGVFIAIVGGYFLMATQYPLAYIVATYEDLVGEWAQVFLFATTLVLAIKVAGYSSRYRLFFAILALACCYVVGEEISWGQRLFDISTPDLLKTYNLQNEMNLHNIFTGPINTWTKQLLEYGIASGLVGYGLLYPYLLQRHWKPALWLNNKGLAFPPLYLWPFFVASGLLELGLFSFNEAEIAEILIPLALAIMAFNYLLAFRQQQDLLTEFKTDKGGSLRLARQTAAMVLCVTLLALGTTAAGYNSPTLKSKIESRYLNGVKKFADRYSRQGKWKTAEELYQRVLAKEPDQPILLRKLSKCYLELNDQATALEILNKAVDIDFEKLQKNPYSVETNLSLVRSYKLLGKDRNAQVHLGTALQDAKTRVKKEPENAAAVYWLGEAQEMSEQLPAALYSFKQATKLRPDVLRYRKAALRLSRKVEGTN